MARHPIITSPCPVRWSSLPQAGKDHCALCDRRVHNLDGMGEAQRKAFLAGCSGKVCVAYTVNASRQRRNVALGAGLLAALAVPGVAMANEEAIGYIPLPTEGGAVDSGTAHDEELLEIIMVGGIESPTEARWADDEEIRADAPAEPDVISDTEWLPSAPE